jgi:hypothetical protein
MMRDVLKFPPRDSYKIRVNFESQYETYSCLVVS